MLLLFCGEINKCVGTPHNTQQMNYYHEVRNTTTVLYIRSCTDILLELSNVSADAIRFRVAIVSPTDPERNR